MYSAQTAAWAFGSVAFGLFPIFIGAVLVIGALLRPWHPAAPTASRLAPGAVGILFLGAGMLGLYESIALTLTCTSQSSIESARTIKGTVSSVEHIGKFGSQYYRFSIDSEHFSSSAPGLKSECGFKRSLAQSMYPPVGKPVLARAIGSTIIELHVVK